jgi:hypothetical protein
MVFFFFFFVLGGLNFNDFRGISLIFLCFLSDQTVHEMRYCYFSLDFFFFFLMRNRSICSILLLELYNSALLIVDHSDYVLI